MSAAPEKKPPEKKPPEKPIEGLTQGRLQLAETARNVFRIYVANGVRPEQILEPSYWAHTARMYKMFDKIEALAEDGSWYMELLVIDCGNNFARVSPIQGGITELQPFEPEARATPVPGHSVKWAGVHAKFRVTRDADNKVLKDGFESKASAWTWLDNYGKSLAA